jgi:hypothetical protein
MARPPIRFARRPVDPRSRAIVSAGPGKRPGRLSRKLLHLECGHTVSRLCLEAPERAICTLCPAAGGHGGHMFEVKGEAHYAEGNRP